MGREKGARVKKQHLQGFIVGVLVTAVIGVAVYATLPGAKRFAGPEKQPVGTADELSGTFSAGTPPVIHRMFPTKAKRGPTAGRADAGDMELTELVLTPVTWSMRGFALCNGEEEQVRRRNAVFTLLGNIYGGDGVKTFDYPALKFSRSTSAARPDDYSGKLRYQLCREGTYPNQTTSLKSLTAGEIEYWIDPSLPQLGEDDLYLGQIVLITGLDEQKYKRYLTPCDGRVLDAGTNYALCAVLGNTFGGDGVNDFALPDLTDASPIEMAKYYIVSYGVYPQPEPQPAP